jgi:hypothetical protein
MTTSKQTPVIKPNYCNLPTDIEGFDSLAELALDLQIHLRETGCVWIAE